MLPVVLSPLAGQYHDLLVLLPFALLGLHARQRRSQQLAAALLVAGPLLVAPLPYKGL